jgi:hypothetical protein
VGAYGTGWNLGAYGTGWNVGSYSTGWNVGSYSTGWNVGSYSTGWNLGIISKLALMQWKTKKTNFEVAGFSILLSKYCVQIEFLPHGNHIVSITKTNWLSYVGKWRLFVVAAIRNS